MHCARIGDADETLKPGGMIVSHRTRAATLKRCTPRGFDPAHGHAG
jgi:hypothetical protein